MFLLEVVFEDVETDWHSTKGALRRYGVDRDRRGDNAFRTVPFGFRTCQRYRPHPDMSSLTREAIVEGGNMTS